MNGDVRRYIARNRSVLAFVAANSAALGAAPIVAQRQTALTAQQAEIERLAQEPACPNA